MHFKTCCLTTNLKSARFARRQPQPSPAVRGRRTARMGAVLGPGQVRKRQRRPTGLGRVEGPARLRSRLRPLRTTPHVQAPGSDRVGLRLPGRCDRSSSLPVPRVPNCMSIATSSTTVSLNRRIVFATTAFHRTSGNSMTTSPPTFAVANTTDGRVPTSLKHDPLEAPIDTTIRSWLRAGTSSSPATEIAGPERFCVRCFKRSRTTAGPGINGGSLSSSPPRSQSLAAQRPRRDSTCGDAERKTVAIVFLIAYA